MHVVFQGLNPCDCTRYDGRKRRWWNDGNVNLLCPGHFSSHVLSMRKRALEDYKSLRHVGGLNRGDGAKSTSYFRASVWTQFCLGFSLTISIKGIEKRMAVILGGNFHLTSHHRIFIVFQFGPISALVQYHIQSDAGGEVAVYLGCDF